MLRQRTQPANLVLFQEDELPKLVSVTPGRERTFFVSRP